MKKYLLLLTLALLLPQRSPSVPSPLYGGVSIGFFYSSLSPYGEWIEIDAGVYAWRPYHVAPAWRPYLYGRWAWTDYGWYWVSSEPFGWAAYHYGRWYYDDFYGWIWIPDDVWGPAWVEWRYGGDYIGWAPLPPYAHFSISIGIRFSTRWYAPAHYWSFMHCRYMSAPLVTRYVVDGNATRRLIRTSRSAGGYEVERDRIINRGIDRSYIERRGRTRVERMEVADSRDRSTERVVREGARERIEVFRPNQADMEKQRDVRIDARRSDRKTTLDIGRIERPNQNVNREERGARENERREMKRTEPTDTRKRDTAPPRERREQYIPQPRPDSRTEPQREFRVPRIETRPDVRREQQDARRQRPSFERPQSPGPRMERQAPTWRQESRPSNPQNQPRREERKRGRD